MSRRGPVLVVDNRPSDPTDGTGLVAVCVTSLEGLGRLVSRFGSEAGGVALQDYVDRLESVLEEDDQLIQINESKYCLLLKHLGSQEDVRTACEVLERVFVAPLMFHDSPIRLELRAGIASGDAASADAEDLFRAAEAARERAVQRRIVWAIGDANAVVQLQRDWRLAEDLGSALARRDLELYCQPEITALEGRLCGAEGLIRWSHPDGVLTPEHFLPHLDASGLLAISEYVLELALDYLHADADLPELSVNLPALQLLDPAFRQHVRSELAGRGLDPGRLSLEVIEAEVMANVADMVPALADLRAAGVRIVLDDCGAGRTSLGAYRDLPVDGIKLDRKLVHDVLDDRFGAYLCRMLIDFAQFRNLQVTAKGVESTAQFERLLEFGCDRMQGFGISPPLTIEAFRDWRGSRGFTGT